MPSIVNVAKQRQLNNGGECVEDFLNWLVVSFSNHCKGEVFLTRFRNVDNSVQEVS